MRQIKLETYARSPYATIGGNTVFIFDSGNRGLVLETYDRLDNTTDEYLYFLLMADNSSFVLMADSSSYIKLSGTIKTFHLG